MVYIPLHVLEPPGASPARRSHSQLSLSSYYSPTPFLNWAPFPTLPLEEFPSIGSNWTPPASVARCRASALSHCQHRTDRHRMIANGSDIAPSRARGAIDRSHFVTSESPREECDSRHDLPPLPPMTCPEAPHATRREVAAPPATAGLTQTLETGRSQRAQIWATAGRERVRVWAFQVL